MLVNSPGRSLKEFKLRLSIWPNNSSPWYTPKRNWKHVHTKILSSNVHSIIIHNSQKVEQPKCPSVDQFINKAVMQWIITHPWKGMEGSHCNMLLSRTLCHTKEVIHKVTAAIQLHAYEMFTTGKPRKS